MRGEESTRSERDIEFVPLTNCILQRNTSKIDDDAHGVIIAVDNPLTQQTNGMPHTKSSEGNVRTVPQRGLRSILVRRLGFELVISLLLCCVTTTLPHALQRQKCSTELADRPPPFQLLESSGELILDPSLNHPKLSSTISTPAVFMTCFTIPIFVVGFTAFLCPLNVSKTSQHNRDVVNVFSMFQISLSRITSTMASLSSILATLGLSETITQTLKAVITRRRPNFYALCKFDVATRTCTNSDFWKCEGQFSFPSGHSSLAMCSSTFLSLFLVSHILRSQRLRCCRRLLIAMTVVTLLGWALFVAATRLVDHYHHYDDVLAGLLLGALVSNLGVHWFFPPLWHAHIGHVGTPWSVLFLLHADAVAETG